MSRTFRCKTSAPKGTIVRDGNPVVCYDGNNISFRSFRYCTSVWTGHVREYSLYGITNPDFIHDLSANTDYKIIHRGLSRWTKKSYYGKRRRKGVHRREFIRIVQRSARRNDRELLKTVLLGSDFELDYTFLPRNKKNKHY